MPDGNIGGREISQYDNRNPRQIQAVEEQLVTSVMREFNMQATYRNAAFAGQWEESASLILPTSRNTFFFGNTNTPGIKQTQLQVDATGMMALHRFAAICDSLTTPRNMQWHQLVADDDSLMRKKRVREWYETATRILFRQRYAPHANFTSQNLANFQGLGAFGNGSMYVDMFDGRGGGLRYRGCPLGETFWGENHQGIVNRMTRWFKLTAWQAEEKWKGQLPEGMQTALKQGSPLLFDFLHSVVPRDDYDPEAPDERRLPYRSCYVSLTGKCVMWNPEREGMEQGFRSFPFSPLRYDQAPNESYGRGPAQMVLPALKTLNAQKKTFLKQGHRAADPVLLSADDGIMNFSMRPGALNKGGMSPQGQPLVGILPTGDIATNEKMMEMETRLINDAFLVSLFQILTEGPQMTATEVIERTHEKGILIGPSLGRLESEHQGPMIDRELDVLAAQGLIPQPPPELIEARGGYKVVYQSPLSKAQHAQEVSGTLRVIENVREVVAITGNPEPLDRFNMDNFVEDSAIISGTRERWLHSDDEIAAIREQRAQAQQQQSDLESLPGKAAIMNSQAKLANAPPLRGRQ